MVATNIDGHKVACEIQETLKEQVERLSTLPGLALIVVGDAGSKFVAMKKRACIETGIVCYSYIFPSNVSQENVIEKINELNNTNQCHGIHMQLPLPHHLDQDAVINNIALEKDVDGMNPLNIGKLCQSHLHIRNERLNWKNLDSIPFNIPPTPQGCMELLDYYKIPIKGKTAVVVGRSNLVGTPMARLLMHRDATVTIVHSKTPNPASLIKQADILVTAVGKANFVSEKWLKAGCVVLDIGINRVPNAVAKKGYVLVGDVDHEGARRVASQVTPVGAVGPMTIAMLLRNTVHCCQRQQAVDLRASF